jgi:hypothetical protein
MVSGLGGKRRGKRNSVARAFRPWFYAENTGWKPVPPALRAGWKPAPQGHLAEPLEGRVLLATVYVDSNPAITTHDGLSWATAYADLQPVLTAAVSGTTIKVADGTYRPTSGTDRTISFVLKNGVGLYGGYAGFWATDPDARDVGAYLTILSGDVGTVGQISDNSYHVVVGSNTDASAVLDGFTITAGNANGSSGTDTENGGGIFSNAGSPTIANCTLVRNSSTNHGGGMYNVISSPTLTNCMFRGNSAYGNGGGGMFNVSSSPAISNCVFSNNFATNQGGAIYNYYTGVIRCSPRLTNCTFSGNAAKWGGGIHNWYASPILTNCIIWGNIAPIGAQIYQPRGATTATFCDIQAGFAGDGNLDLDPMFIRNPTAGTDGKWGTADDDYGDLRLQACSPVADAGKNSAVPTGLLSDLAGNNRFADIPTLPDIGSGTGPMVDMGAYEAIPSLAANAGVPYFVLTDQSIALSGHGASTLAGTIRYAWEWSGDGKFDEAVGANPVFLSSGLLPWTVLSLSLQITDSVGNIAQSTTTLTVIPAVCYVDADATGANDGTSWNNAFSTLDVALRTAVAGVPGQQVRVAEGTYRPTVTTDRSISFQLKSGVSVLGGYAGYGDANPEARDVSLYPSVLSGDVGVTGFNDDNSYHVVVGSDADSTAVLDGFTITGGNGHNDPSHFDGGGLYNFGGSPTIISCIFSGNSAGSGGGVCNLYASPRLINCVFEVNSAWLGGGIYNGLASPTLTNCTFTGNSAYYSGGGIYNYSSSPQLANCIFWGNVARSGPQVYQEGGGTLAATYCDIEGGYPGTGNINSDPLFVRNPSPGPDGIWGTADDDYGDLRLQLASPCIDAGNNAAVPAGVTTDLAGVPRFLDVPAKADTGLGTAPIVDMGAYETLLPPGQPDLLADSDTGLSDMDNLTSFNNSSPAMAPSFAVAGTIAGYMVNLYADGVLVSTGLASSCTTMLSLNGTSRIADGPHIFIARLRSPGGGFSLDSPALTVTVDAAPPTTPPAPDLQSSSDGGVSDTDDITNVITPTFDVVAGPFFRFYRNWVQISGDYESGTCYAVSPRADGTYSYGVAAVDEAGNVSPLSPPLAVTIDSTILKAPSLVASCDTGLSDSDRITCFDGSMARPLIFTVPGTAAGVTVTIYANGVPLCSAVSEGGEVTVFSDGSDPLADGMYLITARQQLPGQPPSLDSDFLTLTIDTTAPAAARPDLRAGSDTGISYSDNLTNDNTPTFGIAAPYYSLYRNGVLVAGPYASGPYTSPLLADGTYLFSAMAIDAAGNMAAPSPWLAVTVDAKAPSAPEAPDLQGASDSGISETDNLTNVKAPAFTVAGTPYFRFFRNGTQISGNYESGTSYTTTAQSDGTYNYTVVAVDAAGNVSVPSAPLSVTIDTVAPSWPSAPDLQATSDSGCSSTDNITNVTTPTFAVAGGPYFRFSRNGTQISGNYESGTSYATPAQADSTYTYTVAAVDATGNVSTLSSGLSVTIDTVAPPVPSAPDLRATGDTGISNTDNITSARYPVFSLTGGTPYFRFYRGDTRLSGSYATGSTFTAAAQPDGTWSYALAAVDVAGNESAQSQLSVTIDSAAPTSQVASLPPASSQDSFTVSWVTEDNAGGSGVANYDIYVSDNGAAPALWLDHTTATSAAYTGQFGHNYSFFSAARDIAGNLEAPPATPDTQTTILSTWNGTASDDQFALRLDPTASLVEFYTTGPSPAAVPVFTVPLGIMIPFTINGQGGHDTLTGDFTNGNPIPPGSIALDASGGTFALNILGLPGNDIITLSSTQLTCNSALLPLAAVQSVALNTSAGDDTVNLDGSFTLPYTLQFGAGADTLNIQGGTCIFLADLGSGADVALNLTAGAKVTFGSTQHLRSLGLGASTLAGFTPSLKAAIFAKGLTIGGTGVSLGKLDLADSDLVLGHSGSSPYESVRPWLLAGMVAGRGIFSSTGSVSSPTVLGLADNAMIRQITWDGRTVSDGVNFKQLLTKRTLFGDANLDGRVDEHDELTILTNMGRVGATYFEGDVNYGGAVTLDDLAIVQANLGAGLAMTGTNLLVAPVKPAAPIKSATVVSAAKSTPAASAKSVAKKVVKLAKTKVRKPKVVKKAKRS